MLYNSLTHTHTNSHSCNTHLHTLVLVWFWFFFFAFGHKTIVSAIYRPEWQLNPNWIRNVMLWNDDNLMLRDDDAVPSFVVLRCVHLLVQSPAAAHYKLLNTEQGRMVMPSSKNGTTTHTQPGSNNNNNYDTKQNSTRPVVNGWLAGCLAQKALAIALLSRVYACVCVRMCVCAKRQG